MKQKTKVRIRENSWLARLAARKLHSPHMAMVVGKTIHLHNTTAAAFLQRQSWVLHELKHVAQYEKHGFWGFLWRYAADYLKNGYDQNRFEVEARNAEKETALLEQYQLILPPAQNKKA